MTHRRDEADGPLCIRQTVARGHAVVRNDLQLRTALQNRLRREIGAKVPAAAHRHALDEAHLPVVCARQGGNIVLLSSNLMDGNWERVLHYLVPLCAFALGVLTAEKMQEHFRNMQRLHWRQLVVLGEVLLLFLVGFLPQEQNLLANAIVSFSCAMQVQTFRKVNGYAYASTMCIGNMRSGMEALAVWIVKHDPKALRKVFHYLGIIFLFGVGAGLGWVAVEHFATRAIWWSCLLLVICFALMFIREDLEDNPAIEQDLAEIRQEAGEIDHLLKKELHEEHEALRDTLEHKN